MLRYFSRIGATDNPSDGECLSLYDHLHITSRRQSASWFLMRRLCGQECMVSEAVIYVFVCQKLFEFERTQSNEPDLLTR